jgi:hypothetical protein
MKELPQPFTIEQYEAWLATIQSQFTKCRRPTENTFDDADTYYAAEVQRLKDNSPA